MGGESPEGQEPMAVSQRRSTPWLRYPPAEGAGQRQQTQTVAPAARQATPEEHERVAALQRRGTQGPRPHELRQ